MTVGNDQTKDVPVAGYPKHFDKASGGRLERGIFNHRLAVMILFGLATVALLYQMTKIGFGAGIEKMVPRSHSFMKNFLENKGELRRANVVRVVVENTQGDIFNPEYLETLQQINNDLYSMPGVERAGQKSIWMPTVRWMEVTEDGFQGDAVMPDTYDGSPESIAQLKVNIAHARITGTLVANNFQSTMVYVPLLENDADTGKPVDLRAISMALEKNIRARQNDRIRVHIIGPAKLVGDLVDGLVRMLLYFGVAAVIAGLLVFSYTRCLRGTVLAMLCPVLAVVWQLGLIAALGFKLDHYTILVPLLFFAIGVGQGVPIISGVMQHVGRGTGKYAAARYTFRRLFPVGLPALAAVAIGFAVLMPIDIPVMREFAFGGVIGAVGLVFTNLILLPIFLSYSGVTLKGARRFLTRADGARGIWTRLDNFTGPRRAGAVVVISALLVIGGIVMGTGLKVGDRDPGSPELRARSRYNDDNAYIGRNYQFFGDVFAVLLRTPPEECYKYESLVEADRLSLALREIPGVQSTASLADAVRLVTSATYDGSPKWYTLSRNQEVLNVGAQQASAAAPELISVDSSLIPIVAFLSDHKVETLEGVANASETFARQHSTLERQFLPAAGSAAIEAAIDDVVKGVGCTVLPCFYAILIALCFIVFRNWRAVVAAVLPLVVTTVLCGALMMLLGMGLKPASLSAVALGAGVSVSFCFYLWGVRPAGPYRGESGADAGRHAVQFTGGTVMLTGILMAGFAASWAFSPIKFQAELGILLVFGFLSNMAGALVLAPALSHFLPGGQHAGEHAADTVSVCQR
jgi:hypothetical protein